MEKTGREEPRREKNCMKKTIIQTTTIVLILFELTILSLFLFLRPKYAFGTIDTNVLIAKQSQILAKHYPHPQGKVSNHLLQQGADQIKEKVRAFAKENNLVLIAKGAIWGGTLPDYTEKVLQALDTSPLEQEY
jgi:hypothetical protein